jgi:hypothetical protein
MSILVRRFAVLILAAYATLSIASAKGDWNYDFESPLPASFVFNAPNATFSGGVENGVLRISDPHVAEGVPLGGVGRETSQVFRNARISGVVNAAGTSDDGLGLLLNGAPSGEATYAARIEFFSGRLAVFKVADFMPVFVVGSDSPEQGSQPLLSDLARSYFLEFDVMGNVLDARVFDQAGGTELLHVHHVDDQGIGGPPLPPGFAGVSAFRPFGSLDGTFDNLSVTAIPEPSSLLLAGLGLAGFGLFRRTPRTA